jgi:antitoxin component YwqK of YwqJK toxin-antitoxin module
MKKKIFPLLLLLLPFKFLKAQDSTICGKYFQCEKINDTIFATGNYHLGKKSGVWVFYKENTIHKIANYVDGFLEGKSYYFNAQGILIREADFMRGKYNGVVKFHSSTGKLLAIYEYTNSIKGKTIFYLIDPEMPPKKHNYRPEY